MGLFGPANPTHRRCDSTSIGYSPTPASITFAATTAATAATDTDTADADTDDATNINAASAATTSTPTRQHKVSILSKPGPAYARQ